MAGPRNPELERVLAALNGYTPRAVNKPNTQDFGAPTDICQPSTFALSQSNSTKNASPIPGLGFLSEPVNNFKPITPPPVNRQQSQTPTQDTRLSVPRINDTNSRSTTPTIPDASAITTWPSALKHVTKYLVPDEKTATRIKHLISEQHKHEHQWWAGREAIIARQEGSTGASQQVAALLLSLGGKSVPIAPTDPKANEAELATYDKKVYAGLLAMTSDFDRQLKNLGVPFYAIKHELVILENGPEKTSKGNVKRVDKGELRELQMKMLQTLEDLFSD